MIYKSFQNDLSLCLGSADTALCLPPLAYVSDKVFKYENENFLNKGWVPIGRADRLFEIGDYETLDISGHPVILIRGCLLYTSPSPRDATLSRMPSSA